MNEDLRKNQQRHSPQRSGSGFNGGGGLQWMPYAQWAMEGVKSGD